MTRTLELPQQVHDAVIAESHSLGLEPSEWIASLLPSQLRRVGTEAERKAAMARLLEFAETGQSRPSHGDR